MPANLIEKDVISALAARAAGLDNGDGNPRVKQVVNRLLVDLMAAIDELDISMDEFWTGIAYLGQAGKQNEFGLIVPGVVLEHFLDLRLDEAERRAGLTGGTARTIEGPLYIAGAPLAKAEARLDDGTDDGEVLLMGGQVRDRPAGRSPAPSSMCGTPTRWETTRISIRRRRPITSVAGSRPTRTAATASARSCRAATPVRRAARPRSC